MQSAVDAASVEEIVRQLISLRASSRLRREDTPIAKDCLIALKRRGYTPEDIEAMTQGKWKVSIIKHYTKGVQAECGSIGPRESLGVITDMASQGIDFEQVRNANAIKKTLDTYGVSLDNVAEIIAKARDSGIDIASIVDTVAKAREAGIAIADLGQALSHKRSLDAIGIDTKKLVKLREMVAKQGERDFDKTVEYINAFDGLEALKVSAKQLQSANDSLQATKVSMQAEVKGLEDRKAAAQSSLDVYQRLEKKGFTEASLAKLEESSRRYGGPDELLNAINKYSGRADLESDMEKTRSDAKEEQAALEKLKADHLHLEYEISMCKKLFEAGYTIPAIERVTSVAKKLGPPVEVMKALEGFGNIAEIGEAQEKARNHDRIAQELAETKETVQQLRVKTANYEEIQKSRDEAQAKLVDLDKRSSGVLGDIFAQLENPPSQRKFDSDLVESGLPELVEKKVEDEVTRRLIEAGNDALRRRFTDEVRAQIRQYSALWSTLDLGPKTAEKVKMLGQMDLADPFVVLKGEWRIDCRICDDNHTLRLERVRDIKVLLLRDHIRVEAPPIFNAFMRKHSIDVSLKDIVKLYLRKGLRKSGIDYSDAVVCL